MFSLRTLLATLSYLVLPYIFCCSLWKYIWVFTKPFVFSILTLARDRGRPTPRWLMLANQHH